MAQTPEPHISEVNDSSVTERQSLGALRLLFDTTWRIAVPVISFTAVGIVLDLRLHTKPWITLVAMVIGFVFAILLIKRLLEAVASAELSNSKEKK